MLSRRMAATIPSLVDAPDDSRTQAGRSFFPLALLFAINTVNFYDRQVLGVLTEPIRQEFGLSDRAIGTLGTAFILFYAVAGLPLGRLCDVAARKWVLSAGTFLWSLATLAAYWAGSFAGLFASRVAVGVGEAACSPAASSLIGDIIPAERRGRALSIFMLGLPAGIALSFYVSSRVASAHGWRAAFLVAGLPGLLLSVAALALKEPVRGAADRGRGAPPDLTSPTISLGSSIALLLRNPTIRWIAVSGIFLNFNMYALGIFLTAYLRRHHELPLAQAGDAMVAIYGLSGLPGLLAGGRVADLVAGKGARNRLLVAAGSILVSAPLAYLSLEQDRGHWLAFSFLMGFACLFQYVYYSTVYPAIQDLVEPRLRGMAMAVYFAVMYFGGGALGPFLTGALSDHFTRAAAEKAGIVDLAAAALEPFKAEGLRSALGIVPILSLVLAGVLFAAAMSARSDSEPKEVMNP